MSICGAPKSIGSNHVHSHRRGSVTIDSDAAQQCLYDIKYAGYVSRQQHGSRKAASVGAQARSPPRLITPASSRFATKPAKNLVRIRPLNLEQAKRISGITPADIALLLAHLEDQLANSLQVGRLLTAMQDRVYLVADRSRGDLG